MDLQLEEASGGLDDVLGVTELRYGLASDQARALLEWYGKAAESGWRGWLLEKALHPAAVPS